MYNKEAIKYGSTMATGFVLLNIDAEGTASTSLGKKLGMEATSLSRLLNSMEEKNLIMRAPNPKDRRSVLIFLTTFGKSKRNDSREVVLKFNNVIEKSLTNIQIKHFFEVANCIKEKSKKFEHF
tara:strand:+ start:225 stop:596 length:372 start_codon:yes stop_codon:yes gene_type:complete